MGDTEDPGSAGELNAIPSWLQITSREAHLCWLEDEEGRAGQGRADAMYSGGALDLDQHKAS